MDALAIIGTLSLGILVGLLIGWYLDQEQPFTMAALLSITSILSGAGVLGVFRWISPVGGLREFWFYPIGLLVGVLIAPPLDSYYNSLFEARKKANGLKNSMARES